MVDAKKFWEDKILGWEASRYSSLLALYPPSWPVRKRLNASARAILERMPGDAAILELGCGSGYLAEKLAGKFSSFTGVDLASNAIDAAKRRVGKPGFTFHAADVTEWSAFSCDLTVFLGLTDWLDPRGMRSLFARISSRKVLFSYTQVSELNPYKLYRWMMDPDKRTENYGARNYTEAEIAALLRENGFSFEFLVRPSFFNPGALVWAERNA